MTHGTKEAIWLRQMCDELAIPIESVPMFVENQSAIKLASNTEFHKRSKHVISRKEIEIHYVQSKQQLADIFTKPLPAQQFCFLRERINVRQTIQNKWECWIFEIIPKYILTVEARSLKVHPNFLSVPYDSQILLK